CLDGLLFPERTPKPALWEHRQLAAPVRVGATPRMLAVHQVQVENRAEARRLDWLTAPWEVAEDGRPIESGPLPLPDLAPGARAPATVPWTSTGSAGDGERWLTIRFRTVEPSGWAPAGFEVAWAQFRLDRPTRGAAPAAAAGPGPGSVARPAAIPLDADGLLVHPLLAAPPTISLWRAPTDNDRIGGMADAWAAWGLDGLDRHLVSIARAPGTVTVRSVYTTGGGHRVPHRQTIARLADGGFEVAEAVTIPAALRDVPRVGSVCELAAGLEHLTWFGTGPHETYPDRARGAQVGRWVSTVADQTVPYIRPQENGGHAAVRWLEVRDRDRRRGLRLELDRPRQVSATHYRDADLARATHFDELTPQATTILHVDAAHRGLGTASCGPDTLPEYLMGPGRYRWVWRLGPLEGG
ncbi:MAG: beta-galactosidase domain 4-containing protein, partial [Candidatus Limnocylindrales bacterium]